LFTAFALPVTAVIYIGETKFAEYLSVLFGILHILTELLNLLFKRHFIIRQPNRDDLLFAFKQIRFSGLLRFQYLLPSLMHLFDQPQRKRETVLQTLKPMIHDSYVMRYLDNIAERHTRHFFIFKK